MHNGPDRYGQDRAQVRQLAPKVAAALGDGWTVGDDEWSSGALLSHADGRRLYFAADWRSTGRVVIGGHYPSVTTTTTAATGRRSLSAGPGQLRSSPGRSPVDYCRGTPNYWARSARTSPTARPTRPNASGLPRC